MIHFDGLTILAAPLSPTNVFAPASTPADSIHGLYHFVLAVTSAIFLLVFGMLLYAAVKYRTRRGDDREPPQIHESDQLEFALEPQLQIAKDSTTSFTETLKLFTQRYEGGVSSKLDTSRAEAAQAAAAAAVPEYERQMALKEDQIQLYPEEHSLARTELNWRVVIVQLYRALGGWNLKDSDWQNTKKPTASASLKFLPASSAATRCNVSLEVKHCDSCHDRHGSAACCV